MQRPSFFRVIPFILGGILLLISVATAGWYYYQYKKLADAPAKAAQEAEVEIKTIVGSIEKGMLLPPNETPTLATVTDKDKLASQPFFAQSQNGDKVLLYTQAGKAILYRPSIQKVVDITTIRTNTESTDSAKPSTSATTGIPIALYNGTTRTGLATAFEKKITTDYPQLLVAAKSTAAQQYPSTIVVDISGKQSTLAQTLATAYGGSVGQLPAIEQKPTADLLLILGENVQ